MKGRVVTNMASEGVSPLARAARSSQFIYNLGIDKQRII